MDTSEKTKRLTPNIIELAIRRLDSAIAKFYAKNKEMQMGTTFYIDRDQSKRTVEKANVLPFNYEQKYGRIFFRDN